MANNEMARYLFHQGTNFHSYEYLGVSCRRFLDKYEYTFRTWAPNARSVGLVSNFTGWTDPLPFEKITDKGVWELVFLSDRSLEGEAYKFAITSDKGVVLKGDPYARYSRGRDDGASLIFTEESFAWTDKAWQKFRKKTIKADKDSYLAAPLNIYEMHFGSFMRHDDGRPLSYLEMADILPSYLKRMGYTHVEFLPLQEHPFDGSWGYQICAFYAITSRFGTPSDFKHLVNMLHEAGIGVILDWVPAHFPKDEWGLFEFDGRALYEYQGIDRQESHSWGTRFFDLGREEVQSFLISNALYFFREFHVDGLRVDAVASMIYLDYDRLPGEWIPNSDGTNENKEAVSFIRKLNTAVFSEFPDALMIAEESGSFGKITAPVSEGGLGFNLKWNMGFANDFYEYLSTDPAYRKEKHSALNFPIMYAFSENYCLPISHDEVVHGKRSFLDKCHGAYEDKFMEARAALLLIYTYPGKKLTFMGTEYAPFREWDFSDSLEWFMLDYPKHRAFRDYTAALNHFYLSRSELWDLDFSQKGFEWIYPDECEKNVVAFRRFNKRGNSLVVLVSFSDREQSVFIPLCEDEELVSVFNTGNISDQQGSFNLIKTSEGQGLEIKLPGYSGLVLESRRKNLKKQKKEKNCVL